MDEKKKAKLFGIIYGIILVGFTLFAVLDAFVIPHAYDVSGEYEEAELAVSADSSKLMAVAGKADNTGLSQDKNTSLYDKAETSVSKDTSSETAVSEDSVSEDSVSDDDADKIKIYHGPQLPSTIVDESDFLELGTYEDENIRIIVNRYKYCDTYVFAAEVVVSSPAFLKTAFAYDTYGRNITKRTTEIAADHGAILAINGDFYGARQAGYVVRNGILYGDVPNYKSQDLAILGTGNFVVFNEADISCQDVFDAGAWQVLSFGPGLVIDGQISVGERQEVSHASYSNPRTAIGMIDLNHYYFVVSDGRTDISRGLSLYELATFMQAAGCRVAYNLDGGGSSTFVFKGELLNNPCPGGGYITERSVSDIVYIGY